MASLARRIQKKLTDPHGHKRITRCVPNLSKSRAAKGFRTAPNAED
jgi:hypothetical protein